MGVKIAVLFLLFFFSHNSVFAVSFQKLSNIFESVSDISDDGSVVVGYAEGQGGHYGAVIWNSGDVTSLPAEFAIGVSNDGLTVVGGNDDPFKWENGQITIMPNLPGYTYGSARYINPDKLYIVGYSGTEACIWTPGNVIGLGWLESHHTHSTATEMSDDGTIVVGYSMKPFFDQS